MSNQAEYDSLRVLASAVHLLGQILDTLRIVTKTLSLQEYLYYRTACLIESRRYSLGYNGKI